MIRHALLFPSSTYLADRWWHRLATVVFWAWLAAIAVYVFKALILAPFASCVRFKYSSLGELEDLDCGSNAFDYAWTNTVAEPVSSILITGLFVVAVLYVSAILPSLLYRPILYISKGRAWHDSSSAA